MAHGWWDYSPSRDSAWETQLTGILRSPAMAPSDTLYLDCSRQWQDSVGNWSWATSPQHKYPLVLSSIPLASSLSAWPRLLGTPVMNEALIQIPLLCEWGGAAEAWSAEDLWVSTEQPEPPSCSTAEGALGNKEKNRMCLGWCSLHVWGKMAWSGNTDKLCVSRSQQIRRTSYPMT